MFIVYLQDYSLSISYFNLKIKKALLFDFFLKLMSTAYRYDVKARDVALQNQI
jgi:hypothetical protein